MHALADPARAGAAFGSTARHLGERLAALRLPADLAVLERREETVLGKQIRVVVAVVRTGVDVLRVSSRPVAESGCSRARSAQDPRSGAPLSERWGAAAKSSFSPLPTVLYIDGRSPLKMIRRTSTSQFRSSAPGFLKQTSIIIHYSDWQAARAFLGLQLLVRNGGFPVDLIPVGPCGR